ncbi:VOC family protein [Pararhodobacter aggregans]|uniref:Glyoxalase n=1 Tax=Pararhodobacter aggregans TaxID=404875 RepID=A0A2T7UKT7_9RHOB|nr:VOC family protein [Pararhodobacter aggregans]PTX02337.1 glyoxalase family protein [Pararhodobacter aggregans]PVE45285.1 glyoxalase [Pararhodobacter aggregans]
MSQISGYHHLTMSTDGAQEDFDFYTKDLGLHSVKRTVLFDGVIPVYHLYYGSPNGDASTIITTFPFRKPGVYGRRGTNQARTIMQAIPMGAADFWVDRLNGRGIEAKKITRFGADRVAFAHPCGIPHELVESDSDPREPITNDVQGIGKAHGIKGIYGGLVACFDRTAMDDFLTIALPLTKEADNHEGTVYRVPDANGVIQRVEVIDDRSSPQGTWTLSGGTIHHIALNTGDEESQLKLRAHIEGLGFTDISEQKDRMYFKSCYVRSPGGALFELAWTTPEGWAKDEAPGEIGKTLVFPPWFKNREDELRSGLEEAAFV